MSADDITFWETIDHLGGVWSLLGVVVVLAVFYVVLVEVMIPRGRISQAERAKAHQKMLLAARGKSQRLKD
ncbi:Aste57867_14026 [Aphanomyces stellatus]|uniref:Aste57867_14026 protein n=1 Tax=Aphanomyces stellatus TaxID=120398 RepID=A0A485L061_9STRA|nr:hypothetical protein As57867_013975 [Aphanomyces stellatus]VFT90856.1 Aste57867_14026 [Aphanomyces stellatus]